MAYYPFNDNARDVSGNGHHGTVYGAVPAPDKDGRANSVYSFDGDDYIETSLTDLSGDAISIAYWFKGSILMSAVRHQKNNIPYVVSGWHGLHILSNDGGLSNGISVDGYGGNSAIDGTWHHIAMTWKKDGIFASYFDGAKVDERPSSSVPIPDIDANVFIGSIWGTGEFINGTLGILHLPVYTFN